MADSDEKLAQPTRKISNLPREKFQLYEESNSLGIVHSLSKSPTPENQSEFNDDIPKRNVSAEKEMATTGNEVNLLCFSYGWVDKLAKTIPHKL